MISLLLLFGIFAFGTQSIEGRKYMLRPLSSREVYHLLYASGRADAVPQGRIITQGLAVISGLTSGITKVISGGSQAQEVTTQEVCFDTRNARSLSDAEAIVDAYARDRNRGGKGGDKVRQSGARRRVKLQRQNKLSRNEKRRKRPQRIRNTETHMLSMPQSLGTAIDSELPLDTGAGINDYTGTFTSPLRASLTTNAGTTAATTDTEVTRATNPTTTATVGDVGNDSDIDDNENDLTTTSFTTWTTPEGAINCIVVQKPK